MSEHPYLIDKPLGATPLEALDMLRRARPELAGAKLAYAGRLDPMASGLLLALHGPLLQRQEDYWELPKEYEATMLVGLQTDTYDLLGIPRRGSSVDVPAQRLMVAAHGLVGKMYLSVPLFSSHRQKGKPLFAWAREGIPGDVEVPVRRMAVSQVDVTDSGTLDHRQLFALAQQCITRVRGDFRQEQIMNAWRELLQEPATWPTVKLRLSCSSGTYVRSLAHELGRRLGGAGMLLELRRFRVGQWRLDDPATVRFALP